MNTTQASQLNTNVRILHEEYLKLHVIYDVNKEEYYKKEEQIKKACYHLFTTLHMADVLTRQNIRILCRLQLSLQFVSYHEFLRKIAV